MIVFYTGSVGRFWEISATPEKRNLIEHNKAPSLPTELMWEPISNSEEKYNSNILKSDFLSKTDGFTITSIAPQLFEWQ